MKNTPEISSLEIVRPLLVMQEQFHSKDSSAVIILLCDSEDFVTYGKQIFASGYFSADILFSKKIDLEKIEDVWGFKNREVILVPRKKDAVSFEAGGEMPEARYNQAEAMLSRWGATVKRVEFGETRDFLEGNRDEHQQEVFLRIWSHLGFEKKTQQIEPIKDYLQILGYSESNGRIRCHFFSHYANRELTINQNLMNTAGFEELAKNAPLEYWTSKGLNPFYRILEKKKKDDCIENIEKYMRTLSDDCFNKGIKQNYEVLKHGAWELEYETGKKERVFHIGYNLLNQELAKCPFGVFENKYMLFACNGLGRLWKEPLAHDEMLEFEKFLTLRAWVEPLAPKLILGAIYASCLAGIIKWRPHLWINAPFSTGKSAISSAIKTLMGDEKGCFFAAGDKTTESGIRRGTDGKAFLVIYEEAEGEITESLEHIIRLARASSDGQPVKQTNKDTHESDSFSCYCMFMMFSIGNNLHKAADQSRFIALNLKKFDKNSHGIFKEIDAVRDKYWTLRMGRRIHYDAYLNADRFIELTLKIKEKLGGTRSAANLAPLCAGYLMMMKRDKSMDYLKELTDLMGKSLKENSEKIIDTDSSNLGEWLCMHDIPIEYDGKRYTKTFAEWCLFIMDKKNPEERELIAHREEIHEKLHRKGIAIKHLLINNVYQWHLHILATSPVLEQITKIYKIKNKLKTMILSLGGEVSKTLRVGKYGVNRGHTIPLGPLLFSDDLTPEEIKAIEDQSEKIIKEDFQ